MKDSDRYSGCLLGLACGDAVGTTVEFSERGTFPPVTDMVGGGPFHLPSGAWTDDTSMALCLATSLAEHREFDPAHQMKLYSRWFSSGYLSSTGRCFDIGNTVRTSLEAFRKTAIAFSGSTDPNTAGNGSIMRLAPVVLFFHPNVAKAVEMAGDSSPTTHGALECVECCQLMALMICAALSGQDREIVLFGHDSGQFRSPKVRAIAAGDYRDYSIDLIKGTGYVIESLEAAAWCFWKTGSFRDAILLAVNLGDDADTTGAVCGQIAGAFYGETGIPPDWIKRLAMVAQIRSLARELTTNRR